MKWICRVFSKIKAIVKSQFFFLKRKFVFYWNHARRRPRSWPRAASVGEWPIDRWPECPRGLAWQTLDINSICNKISKAEMKAVPKVTLRRGANFDAKWLYFLISKKKQEFLSSINAVTRFKRHFLPCKPIFCLNTPS